MALGEKIGGKVGIGVGESGINFPGSTQGILGSPVIKSASLGGKVLGFAEGGIFKMFSVPGAGEIKNIGGIASGLGAKSGASLGVKAMGSGVPEKVGGSLGIK